MDTIHAKNIDNSKTNDDNSANTDKGLGKKRRSGMKTSPNYYHRGFLNVFVIDPTWPMKRSTMNVPNPMDFDGMIQQKVKQFLSNFIHSKYPCLNYQLSMDVIDIIYQMAFLKSRTLKKSKQIRAEIVQLRNEKANGHDRYYHNGNEGEYGFYWDWQEDECNHYW